MALIDPFDDDRRDSLVATLISYLHNLGTDTEKSGTKSPADFLPFAATRAATLSEVDLGAIRVDPRFGSIRERLLREGKI